MASKKKQTELQVLRRELKQLKDPEGSLTLSKTPLTPKQLLTVLQRTPKNHIYKRPGKGGGEWEYVTGTYVKKVLNYVFAWLWDFQIVDKGREGNQVWVQGRLTIKNDAFQPIIVKEQFGRAEIKVKKGTNDALDYGNDLKAAATDALKKCASDLGVASDIYGKEEFKEIRTEGTTAKVVNKVEQEVAARQTEEAKYYCHACDIGISKLEHDFSLKVFGKPLCKSDQNLARQGGDNKPQA